ncbi:hypothetical protein V6N13_058906 [Hibiscus sabdariffa]
MSPWDWNLGMERTLRSWSNTAHSAMRGSYVSSPVPEPLEPPLGHNKLNVGADWRCWFSYVISLEIESLEPPSGYKKLLDRAGLRCGCSHDNSPETDPWEPPLGLNKTKEEAGLRWGCGAELTRSGKYGPD